MKKSLRSQVIDLDHPGTLLRDFQSALDFAVRGIPTFGKRNLPTPEAISELDSQLSRPLRLTLKRPQLRSNPYVEALYLLLRCSALTRIETTEGKSRLAVQTAVLESWNTLNPTERYFTLLEAWCRFADSSLLGERRSPFYDLFSSGMLTIHNLPTEGVSFNLSNPKQLYVGNIGREFYVLALLDLFGLVSVDYPVPPVAPWCPAGATPTPFGKALAMLLYNPLSPVRAGRSGIWSGDISLEELIKGSAGAAPTTPTFGAWQPIVQPYFPAWQNNLTLPTFGFREGAWIFRLELGKVMWRRIAMHHDNTLHDLLNCILDSIDFDSDHLYLFTYTDACGQLVKVGHPEGHDWFPGDQVRIGSLPLQPGESLSLLYDFGDNWEFNVTLEAIEPVGRRRTLPQILGKRGRLKQYPPWE